LPTHCLLRLVYESDSPEIASSRLKENSSETSPPSNNYIRQRGRAWVIRFDGQEEKIYTSDLGFSYLQLLFENPSKTFSVSDLACSVRKRTKNLAMKTASQADFSDNETMPIASGLDGAPALDSEAKKRYSGRLEELDELISYAKESESSTRLDEIEELEKEKQFIDSELRKAKGFKGRVRNLGDGRNRVRNRVCNAIKRALKLIKQYDLRLSEHLIKPVLNLGFTVSYAPRDGMSWFTSFEPTS
jgi:hypothetical protein